MWVCVCVQLSLSLSVTAATISCEFIVQTDRVARAEIIAVCNFQVYQLEALLLLIKLSEDV